MIMEHNTALDVYRAGIYYLRDMETNKIYLGSTSRSFETRFSEHKERLEDGTHHNKAMLADYKAGHIFSAGILCILKRPEFIERVERVLITYYKDAGEPLYNVLGVTLPFDHYRKK